MAVPMTLDAEATARNTPNGPAWSEGLRHSCRKGPFARRPGVAAAAHTAREDEA